jgi:hypothetical protein
VIVIMQENRSFDSYFGTFPGADGIPMKDGKPSDCVPNPGTGGCVRRPRVVEAAPQLGNLMSEFDFTGHPRPPVLLPPKPTPSR